MNRRDLLKAAAILPLTAGKLLAKTHTKQKLIKPKRLAEGDTIGLIAPASGVAPEALDRAIDNLRSLGFEVRTGRFARGRRGFLSGTDAERLEDLHWAFSDPEIKAVWCVRGGGGSPRLLPAIDFDLIRRNPKVFIGLSDITALHVAIHQATGLVTFHGPVGTSEQTDYTRSQLKKVLMQPSAPYRIDVAPEQTGRGPLYKPETLVKGKARGRLVGGNLSLLAALAGTPFALKDLKRKILFIEEINEPPYRVDRLLTQLRQSCDLRSLAGVALGVFEDTSAAAAKEANPNIEVLRDRLADLGVPLVYGLSFGHIRDNCTLPYGIEAELDADAATLTLLEAAVL
jgi:muramoyltetrapeptide carboxypeptidase